MTEQENRIYAADLLHRADVAFDARDIAVLAKVLGTLESDMADWLATRLRGTVSRDLIVSAARAGQYRPTKALDESIATGKPEGNLK